LCAWALALTDLDFAALAVIPDQFETDGAGAYPSGLEAYSGEDFRMLCKVLEMVR
jgi:hypothetical protein